MRKFTSIMIVCGATAALLVAASIIFPSKTTAEPAIQFQQSSFATSAAVTDCLINGYGGSVFGSLNYVFLRQLGSSLGRAYIDDTGRRLSVETTSAGSQVTFKASRPATVAELDALRVCVSRS